MERAPNEWDRFYRFHETAWVGERNLTDVDAFLAGPVLELGAGTGKALRAIQHRNLPSVPLEISFHALSKLGGGVLADARAPPFAPESFGTILDLHCLGHVGQADRRAAAIRLANLLRPGGNLIVERLAKHDLRASQGSSVDGEPGMRELQDGRRTNMPSLAELVAEYRGSGLELVEARVRSHAPKYRGKSVRRAWVRAIFQRPVAPSSP